MAGRSLERLSSGYYLAGAMFTWNPHTALLLTVIRPSCPKSAILTFRRPCNACVTRVPPYGARGHRFSSHTSFQPEAARKMEICTAWSRSMHDDRARRWGTPLGGGSSLSAGAITESQMHTTGSYLRHAIGRFRISSEDTTFSISTYVPRSCQTSDILLLRMQFRRSVANQPDSQG